MLREQNTTADCCFLNKQFATVRKNSSLINQIVTLPYFLQQETLQRRLDNVQWTCQRLSVQWGAAHWLEPQTYLKPISRPDDTWLVEGNSVNSSENCCKDLKISVSVISRLLKILSSGREMAMPTGVVKADFLKAVRKAVSKRFIRLFNEVNRMNDCFEMRKTSVRLRTLNFF